MPRRKDKQRLKRRRTAGDAGAAEKPTGKVHASADDAADEAEKQLLLQALTRARDSIAAQRTTGGAAAARFAHLPRMPAATRFEAPAAVAAATLSTPNVAAALNAHHQAMMRRASEAAAALADGATAMTDAAAALAAATATIKAAPAKRATKPPVPGFHAPPLAPAIEALETRIDEHLRRHHSGRLQLHLLKTEVLATAVTVILHRFRSNVAAHIAARQRAQAELFPTSTRNCVLLLELASLEQAVALALAPQLDPDDDRVSWASEADVRSDREHYGPLWQPYFDELEQKMAQHDAAHEPSVLVGVLALEPSSFGDDVRAPSELGLVRASDLETRKFGTLRLTRADDLSVCPRIRSLLIERIDGLRGWTACPRSDADLLRLASRSGVFTPPPASPPMVHGGGEQKHWLPKHSPSSATAPSKAVAEAQASRSYMVSDAGRLVAARGQQCICGQWLERAETRLLACCGSQIYCSLACMQKCTSHSSTCAFAARGSLGSAPAVAAAAAAAAASA